MDEIYGATTLRLGGETVSRCTSCDYCVEWLNPVPFDEDMGENSEPISFSKNPCDLGDSEQCHLAGSRYIIHSDSTLPMTTGTHLEVCEDCYLKFHGVFEE